MSNIKFGLFILGIFGLVLIGCNDSSKNKIEANSKTSSKTESSDVGYIVIQLEDGSSIELKSPKQQGNLSAPSTLSVNMDMDGIVVMLKLNRYKTPLENKVYEDPLEAQITLTSISHNGALGKETYRSFNENKDGEEGKVKVTLISHSENHSEGTFEATLYSQNMKEAAIKGRFKTKKKK